MRFENSFWRASISAACLAATLSMTACERPATNTPAPTPAPATAPVATPQTITTEVPVASSAAAVKSATPVPAATSSPVIPGPTPIPLEGKDFDVTMLNGSKMKLSKLLGRKKIVVLNFWATWCGPCRKEIPDLIALANQYKGKNVEIVGLTVEEPEQSLPMVKDFIKESQINYEIGFTSRPMFITFCGPGQPRGPIPQTFIFGKDGKLQYHIPGMRVAYKDYVSQAIDIALKSS